MVILRSVLFVSVSVILLSLSSFAQRPSGSQVQQQEGSITSLDTTANTLTLSMQQFDHRPNEFHRGLILGITPSTVYVNTDTGDSGTNPKVVTDVITANKHVQATVLTIIKRNGATMTRVAVVVLYNPPASAPAPAP